MRNQTHPSKQEKPRPAVVTYIRMPAKLHDEIKAHLADYGGTQADFIRSACHQELKRRKR